MADDMMKRIALAVEADIAPWDEVYIREAENSITLKIKTHLEETDYKVIIMKDKDR